MKREYAPSLPKKLERSALMQRLLHTLLEKMAADESVKEKYLGIIDDAKNKISEVKDEIAKHDDSEDGVKSRYQCCWGKGDGSWGT